jgi:guanine nucleotide-binding protein G(s) subunit alpha
VIHLPYVFLIFLLLLLLLLFILFKSILRAMEKINPPIALERPEDQWRATYILTTAHQLEFDYPPEFFEHAAVLWSDAGVQACFDRSNEYQLIDCAK